MRAACSAALVMACSSDAVDTPPPGAAPLQPSVPDNTGSEPGVIDPIGNGQPTTGEACAPGRLSRRAISLSDIQFANSIRALLGPLAVAVEAQPDAALKPFSQKGAVVNTSLLRTRIDLAESAAASLTGRIGELTGCSEGDDVCARGFLADLAHRAFRRPVSAEELADLSEVFAVGREASFEQGVQLATQAVIASPSFSYRTEFGDTTVDATTGARQLGGTELASLLSYWLTDGPPDADLLAAAEAGQLSQPGEIERQVARLLASPAAQDSITLTLMAAWGMSNLFGSAKDPTLFPEYGPLLQSNMFEETRLFLNHVLWSPGSSVDQVLTSRTSFVNAALAKLYGVPFTGSDPTEFVEVELPPDQRAGLLTQPSLLAARSRSDNTSVVARGLFVRSELLCLPRPPPPPEAVIAQVQELLAADLTERERAEFRAATSPCNGCHASIDGFGLMLETYDAIGRYREELNGEPIDPQVALDTLGYPGQFDGAVDFAATAAADPQFSACLARHFAVYATGEDGLGTRDCELKPFGAALPAETSLPQIIAALARSPLLTTRSGD
ncbi:MAG TPA: DUF1592 domain-containing protein [Polyangiaceae bacterium]|nr:DUF1592 domain-containing protein [Polyangiaceae bacterium]